MPCPETISFKLRLPPVVVLRHARNLLHGIIDPLLPRFALMTRKLQLLINKQLHSVRVLFSDRNAIIEYNDVQIVNELVYVDEISHLW
jgi:hypothetical protein